MEMKVFMNFLKLFYSVTIQSAVAVLFVFLSLSPSNGAEPVSKYQTQLKAFGYKLDSIKTLPQFTGKGASVYKLALKHVYEEATKRGVELNHILSSPDDIPDGYRSLEVIGKIYHDYLDRYPEDSNFFNIVFSRLLKEFDKGSKFFTPSDLLALQKATSNRPSIGIKLKNSDSFPVVAYVSENSPSMAAGIKAGDKILKVDGVSVENKEAYS